MLVCYFITPELQNVMEIIWDTGKYVGYILNWKITWFHGTGSDQKNYSHISNSSTIISTSWTYLYSCGVGMIGSWKLGTRGAALRWSRKLDDAAAHTTNKLQSETFCLCRPGTFVCAAITFWGFQWCIFSLW